VFAATNNGHIMLRNVSQAAVLLYRVAGRYASLIIYIWVINFMLFMLCKCNGSLCTGKRTVKQSLYSPGQALRFPGGQSSQISRESAHEGGNVVSPTHRPPLPNRKYSWHSFLLEAESNPRAIVRPEGFCE